MASISSINKGTAYQYITDVMGTVQFKCIVYKTGEQSDCFIKCIGEEEWRRYGIENKETIISLTKYQVQQGKD
jgi:hypothetical protein